MANQLVKSRAYLAVDLRNHSQEMNAHLLRTLSGAIAGTVVKIYVGSHKPLLIGIYDWHNPELVFQVEATTVAAQKAWQDLLDKLEGTR